MNALIRQIAVLSVLWAVCEVLLPEGRYQHMVRMTASLLVMSAMLTSVGGWLGQENDAEMTLAYRMEQTAQDTYQRTALSAAANQAENWCVQLARSAGYETKAAVYLMMDGSVDHVEIVLQKTEGALTSPEELRRILAEEMKVEEARIWLSAEGL